MYAGAVLDQLLAVTKTAPTDIDRLDAWWSATSTERASRTPSISASPTIDRALLGGAQADRLGFTFAVGYSEALRCLVPSLAGVAALCATEAEGNHPRAIRTHLDEVADKPGQFTLTGHKKWATAANHARSLLVVASRGADPTTERNRLVVVHVPVPSPNLHIRSSSAPFVPEIEHAEIELAGVPIAAEKILPGDGYDDYLKPFRTVEDLHVHAALVGYLIGVAHRFALAPEHTEALLALATTTRSFAALDLRAPATHLALAGVLDLVTRVVSEVERAWSSSSESAEWQRWQRDRALFQVASKARVARREAARLAFAAAR
jgi:alkylation response protein AidB-like acyl-CoA dehydrogenase